LGNKAPAEAKPRVSEKPPKGLEWQQVNAVTWRLVDPGARQLLIEASHGQWGGYHYPKALAYVFDVGVFDHDWRTRVRLRGNQWRAWGCIIDLATAKTIAQPAVENPAEPKPSKFNIPLNLIGGHRWPGAPALDSQTRGYIHHVEIGAVKVDAPNEQPTASADDESINLCASDSEVAEQRAKDLADESLDESLYVAEGGAMHGKPLDEKTTACKYFEVRREP
jgi:hypothetical protein